MESNKQQQRDKVTLQILAIVRGWVGMETANSHLDHQAQEFEVRNLIQQYDRLTREIEQVQQTQVST